MATCAVYLLETTLAFDKPYTYLLPAKWANVVTVGSVVVVPFGKGNRKKSAFVSKIEDAEAPVGTKSVFEVLDYSVPNAEEALALSLFLAERCFCTVGSVLRLMLPAGSNVKSTVYYTAADAEDGDELFCFVKSREKVAEREIVRSFGKDGVKAAAALCKRGLLFRHTEVAEKSNVKTLLCVRLTDKEAQVKGTKQKLLLELLADGAKDMRELADKGVPPATVRSMETKGIVEIFERRLNRLPYEPDSFQAQNYTLSEQQQRVRDNIVSYMRDDKAQACLLFGVTGSGKTKIILEAVDEALRQGKGAIVLIPEIGLTAQALSIFFARYGEECAVIHSKLSVGERADTYRRIGEGTVKVVLGTRSAVFAPLKDIGVIVMDEEQEYTYKSEKTPKYHARDVARFRCARHGALMLLASATPSVESYYKAQNSVYHLEVLDERFGGATLPEVSLVDVTGDSEIAKTNLLGTELRKALKETVEKGEQAILFLGRRGYNSVLRCRSCGYVFTCPDCSVSLTYHQYSANSFHRGKLLCHYCGHTQEKPSACPECGEKHIGYFGFGTQLLQDELEEMFGDGRALRMDTDTTVNKRSHEEILAEFRNGEADILYGTQMVVKGLDFPKVTLVGLVMADSVLYMNDYRCGERMFSLITQLVGRAGRSGKKGKALIQTYNPLHQTLRLGKKQDYPAFYQSEIRLRKSVVFPPFCDIAVFSFTASTEQQIAAAATQLVERYDKLLKEYEGLKLIRMGPFRDGIYKIGGKYRNKVIIKYKDSKECRRFFRTLIIESPHDPLGVITELDINPAII